VGNAFQIGSWLVEPSLNTVSASGVTHHLEPKIMEVLVCLAKNAGETIPKERLLQVVWPETFVTDDVLTRSISQLRRVFEDDAKDPRFIQTIPKRGYRLVVPVSPVIGTIAPAALESPAIVLGRSSDKASQRMSWPCVATARDSSYSSGPSEGSCAPDGEKRRTDDTFIGSPAIAESFR
jgi:DNA-binding winged helix-turn-helix (wHTH) protein